jgi:hypothetical protein
MPYSLPSDAREILHLLTTDVIADTAVGSLSLESCRALSDSDIDEAARAGNYDVPFSTTSTASGTYANVAWLRRTSALGTVACARRGLEFAQKGQEAQVASDYEADFRSRLQRLREGKADLGTAVHSQSLALPPDAYTWAELEKAALALGSVTATNTSGTVSYLEDRGAYEDLYRPGVPKDFEVDHTFGRLRLVSGGKLAPGASINLSYTYFIKQPARPQENELRGETAQMGKLRRTDLLPGGQNRTPEEPTMGPGELP